MRKSSLSRRMLLLIGVAIVGTAPMVGALDEAASNRIADYFRRKQNLPTEVSVVVKDVKPSQIKGTMAGTLEMSRGDQKQEMGILLSEDGRHVVFGEVEDVNSDPFAEVMKKISLKDQPSKGPKDAKVTIVEYSDFQCPYCSRAHDTLSQVEKEYGDKIRVVYKNFPLNFHKWAEPAAIAGECIFDQDEKAFWTVYDYYFAQQKDLTPENIKDKTLEALKDKKIDKKAFDDCYDNKKTKARVDADMAEGQEVGVTGTPAFIINGRKISGAQPIDRFKAIIDDELQRGEKKS